MGPDVVPADPNRLEKGKVSGKKFMIEGTQAQFGSSVMMAVLGYTEGQEWQDRTAGRIVRCSGR
jgi:hypothetical protein